MRTINIYTFDELSDEAKKIAIDSYRKRLENGEFDSCFFASWAIDDCALFEPSDKEMQELFGPDYYKDNGDKFMIGNNRKNIVFGEYGLHCKDAMEINNEKQFFKWLGLENFGNMGYELINAHNNTYIRFFDPIDDEDVIGDTFEAAINKFARLIQIIRQRIQSGIDYRYSDEGITEDLEANNPEIFSKEGQILSI